MWLCSLRSVEVELATLKTELPTLRAENDELRKVWLQRFSVYPCQASCLWLNVDTELCDIIILLQFYDYSTYVPSVLWRCWLGGRKGIRPIKDFGGCGCGGAVSPVGVAPTWIVGASASIIFPCCIKIQKNWCFSGSGLPGLSRNKGR